MNEHHFATRQVQATIDTADRGAIVPPIYTSVNFAYESPTKLAGDHRYIRMADPTSDVLNRLIAELEGGDHGRSFASGMAAINTLLTTVLSAGDHVVAGRNLYAETHTLLTRIFAEFGVEVTFVDTTDAHTVPEAITPETALVYFETPTNPLLEISDIGAIADLVADATVDPVIAVDNTFASPYLQNPLDLGADVVVQSLTKYVAGHSDVMAGALVTDDPSLDEAFDFVRYNLGGTPSPFDASLVIRGAKTLSGRMQLHCENARAIAAFLDDHPAVVRVHYPGLPSHPNHGVAADQMADFGGMVSFELDATADETSAVIADTEVFVLAESLGGVESLIEQPAPMTHQDLSAAELEAIGISESLVRLSVGIEHVDDLIDDLAGAIERGLD